MKSILFLISALLTVWAASAFAPSTSPASITIKTARRGQGLQPTHARRTVLMKMSEEKTEEEVTPEAPAAPAKGEAFYDDEYDSAPRKSGISDSMKARLLAEASTGLDSEKKQTNVLLYIIAAVGALVVLGGQGIFF